VRRRSACAQTRAKNRKAVCYKLSRLLLRRLSFFAGFRPGNPRMLAALVGAVTAPSFAPSALPDFLKSVSKSAANAASYFFS